MMKRLTHLDKALTGLSKALESSPADFTELAWIERKISRATSSSRSAAAPRFERTVLVRVRERGRFGFHRLDAGGLQDLSSGVRQAIAQTRVHGVVPLKKPPAPGRLPPLPRNQLFDRDLARLDPEDARELLAGALDRDETAQLEWVEARIAVTNTLGARRRIRVTAGTLFGAAGRGSEAGVARASSRRLDRLIPHAVMKHARFRKARGIADFADPEVLEGPLVLSPEAAASLLEEIGRWVSSSFGTAAALDFLDRCVKASPAPAALSIYDEGGEAEGVPFPFDLSGSAKGRLDLVESGKVLPLPLGSSSPPDQTGCFAAGGEDTQLANLFIGAGEASLDDLLAYATDGVWISALRRLVCYDPDRLTFRAQGRGVRRIRNGQLTEALPDLTITRSLSDLLGRVKAAGKDRLSQSLGHGVFGAVTAPALWLGPSESAQ